GQGPRAVFLKQVVDNAILERGIGRAVFDIKSQGDKRYHEGEYRGGQRDVLDRRFQPPGHGQHAHNADQGKEPEGGQQQVVAHDAVTSFVIRRSRAGSTLLASSEVMRRSSRRRRRTGSPTPWPGTSG